MVVRYSVTGSQTNTCTLVWPLVPVPLVCVNILNYRQGMNAYGVHRFTCDNGGTWIVA